MTIRLHVNIDHVATIRQARGTPYPDPVFAARMCELAGADGITLHLREDRRHIGDADVERMRDAVATLMNLECACTDEMVEVALRVRPDVVTLVPERREERTTEGGLDAHGQQSHLAPRIERMRAAGIKVSLFIAADERQIQTAQALGAEQVEFHTGPYAHAVRRARAAELTALRNGAQLAHGLGLEVAAGHGLTRANVGPIAAIPHLEELNIGHAIVADALYLGLPRAVRAMRAAVRRGERARA